MSTTRFAGWVGERSDWAVANGSVATEITDKKMPTEKGRFISSLLSWKAVPALHSATLVLPQVDSNIRRTIPIPISLLYPFLRHAITLQAGSVLPRGSDRALWLASIVAPPAQNFSIRSLPIRSFSQRCISLRFLVGCCSVLGPRAKERPPDPFGAICKAGRGCCTQGRASRPNRSLSGIPRRLCHNRGCPRRHRLDCNALLRRWASIPKPNDMR